jgi:hypothetical protein
MDKFIGIQGGALTIWLAYGKQVFDSLCARLSQDVQVVVKQHRALRFKVMLSLQSLPESMIFFGQAQRM